MEGGHVGIKVNDQVGKNFQTRRWVRQGDPLSPILFNIVVDMLAILINRAKHGGIRGNLKYHRWWIIHTPIWGWYNSFYGSQFRIGSEYEAGTYSFQTNVWRKN
jgi:retron-type reverse transcriptase